MLIRFICQQQRGFNRDVWPQIEPDPPTTTTTIDLRSQHTNPLLLPLGCRQIAIAAGFRNDKARGSNWRRVSYHHCLMTDTMKMLGFANPIIINTLAQVAEKNTISKSFMSLLLSTFILIQFSMFYKSTVCPRYEWVWLRIINFVIHVVHSTGGEREKQVARSAPAGWPKRSKMLCYSVQRGIILG